jgi:hypothetical protein
MAKKKAKKKAKAESIGMLVLPKWSIRQAAEEAIRVAKERSREVTFSFEGHAIIVDKTSTIDGVEKQLANKQAVKRDVKKPLGQVRSLCRIDQDTWSHISDTVHQRATTLGCKKTDIWIEGLKLLASVGFDCAKLRAVK